ncbi:linker for activation of T-cells family member 2 isoform X3 [Talpa occidentalis]|uniref:linker for activation of T-cells family member 2 isoform X3 n=1 Tax=Talpa occidentalis TaxID=50954 RepID=UPI0023F6CA91|nr:linker for activation of T-cells family member 2 isoform X3 [Talpa occidentalis]
MNADAHLLWPGAALLLLLLLLGVAASLCVRCSRPGVKKSQKIYEQNSLQENQQSFAVAGTYSLVRQAYPGSLMDMVPDAESARKEKLLFSPSLEGSESPRYQNFRKGSRLGSDAAYVEPIAMDYYNWGQCRKALEDDDDTNSYENVLICQQSPDSDEGSDDYQNSSSILQWRKSRKVAEQVRRETCASPESPDEDGEPDYVNGDVSAQKA